MLIAPTDRYQHEGVYLLDIGGGALSLYRCDLAFDGKGSIRLMNDNRHYPTLTVTLDQFNEGVVGKVAAHVIVKDCVAMAAIGAEA